MTRQIISQNSFTSGELSPRLLFRSETGEYTTGLQTATNCVLEPHGPVRRRGGSKYISEVKSSSATVRLVNYQFNQETAFILEFGNTYIRFYKDSGQVLSGGNPYEIVSPYTTAQVADIQWVQSGSTMYLVHPEVTPRQLVRNSDTDWTLSEVSFSPTPTYESGYEPNTTVTPSATTGSGVNFTAGTATWLAADVGRQIINNSAGETGVAIITSISSTTVAVCDIVESFTDTNAIASGDWTLDLSPVCALEFSSIAAGSVANVRSEYVDGTVGPRLAITGITAANPAVVTSNGHGLANGDKVQIQDVLGMTQLNDRIFTVSGVTTNTFNLLGENSSGYTTYSSGGIARKVFTGLAVDAFRSDDVGRYILINGGVGKILSVTAASNISVEILKSLNTSTVSSSWQLEQPTWSSTRGYPRAVGLYEQRLVYGGTTAQPQTVWLSETGIFDGFGAGPDDEDSIEIEIASSQVNQINWFSSGRDLVVGTSGGELTINSGSAGGVTPSLIVQQPRTYHGSGSQHPVNIRDEILFLQGSQRKIRTFRYDFNIDGYTGEDLNFLSEHITEGGLGDIAYAQEPDAIIYAVTDNGELITATYDRAKRVIGWTRYTTDGYYENVQTITNGEEDQVWVVVRRNINGSTKRYVELFVNGNGSDDTHGYSDCFISKSTPLAIMAITKANPAVVTSAAHGLSNGDRVIIKDLVDPLPSELSSSKTNMSSLNQSTFTVANVTTNTFELSGLNTTDYNSYGSGGNAFKKITALTGLGHLEGKTVQIKTDGAAHPNKTVSSGALTLDRSAGEIVIGLPYTTTIKTIAHEFNTGIGSGQGQRVRWARPLLRVYKSIAPTLNENFLPIRNTNDIMDRRVDLFSGYLEYGALDWSNDSALTITLSSPFPLQILGVTGTIDTGVK